MAKQKALPQRNDERLDGWWIGRSAPDQYQLVHVDAWNRSNVHWTELGFIGAKVNYVRKPAVRLAVGEVKPVRVKLATRSCPVLMPSHVRKRETDPAKEADIQREWAERERRREKFRTGKFKNRPEGI